ncbi:MAG TPA: GNAT family N-acetyltransferase [Metabacillus sp.]|nr:GNAT family N-acetyltransferase [Metabacillus sp.]
MKIKKLELNEQMPIQLLLEADPSEQLIMDYVQKGECYVAEIDQQVIGAYVLLEKTIETIEIKNIVIKDEFRGQGLGKKLLLHSIKQARKKGYQALDVGTGNSSIGQLAFYQKCGFRMIGVDLDFFTRHYSEVIIENGIQCRDMILLRMGL